VQKALRGKVKEAAEFVINWFEKNPDGLLRFKELQTAIGMNDPKNFKNRIRQNPDFKEALSIHDIAEAQVLGDNRRGFLKPRFTEALPQPGRTRSFPGVRYGHAAPMSQAGRRQADHAAWFPIELPGLARRERCQP
jgi:hypothetical protein